MKNIILISKEIGIYTYFFDSGSVSEVNNLGGNINIFLNKNQTEKEIWDDFCKFLTYISMEDPYRDDV